jgi:hypothetical protein
VHGAWGVAAAAGKQQQSGDGAEGDECETASSAAEGIPQTVPLRRTEWQAERPRSQAWAPAE